MPDLTDEELIAECRAQANDPRGNKYWPSDTFNRAADAIESSNAEREKMREALVEARSMIEFFHGKPGWKEYQQSPEMQRIDAALLPSPPKEDTHAQ